MVRNLSRTHTKDDAAEPTQDDIPPVNSTAGHPERGRFCDCTALYAFHFVLALHVLSKSILRHLQTNSLSNHCCDHASGVAGVLYGFNLAGNSSKSTNADGTLQSATLAVRGLQFAPFATVKHRLRPHDCVR